MMYKKMRRKVRKPLAVVLSVSMIMSSISMSVLASETEEQKSEPTVTVTVKESKNEETGDTTTTTVTETEWTDTQDVDVNAEINSGSEAGGGEAGETGSEAGGGEAGETGSEVGGGEAGETGSEVGGGEAGETGSETGGEAGETGSEVGPGVSTETTVEVTGEATVTGSETKTEVITTNENGTVTEEAGSIAGQETTITEIVKTETETTTGQMIEETTTPIENSSSEAGEPETTVGEWQTGDETFENYEDGTWTDHEWQDDEKNEDPTTSESTEVTEDVLADEKVNVELNLKPSDNTKGEDKTTVPVDDDVEKVYVSWDDVAHNNVQIPTAGTTETTDEDGNKVTIETTVTPVKENDKIVGYDVTTVTTTTKEGTPVEGETVETGKSDPVTVTSTPELPDDIKAGTEDLLDDSGNVIGTVETKIEEIKDHSGNVIGYTVTKIATEYTHKEEESTATGETTKEENDAVETYVLPEKPQASESINADTGVKIVTTVEDIMENGQLVGYQSITVELDGDGKELSRSSTAIYGTTVVVNTNTITDPTTEVVTTDTTKVTTSTTTIMGTTTTQEVALKNEQTTSREIIEVTEEDSWELVTSAGGDAYFIYKGEMYAVVGGAGNGTLNNNVELDYNLEMYYPDGSNDIRENPKNGGGYTGQILSGVDTSNTNGGVYIGYGLYSNFLINDMSNNGHEVRQYAIKDADGNMSYVYCVELGSGLSTGSYYGEEIMQNGALYDNGYGDVSKLTIVAQNGFWGTGEGVGSLDAVKDLLIRNGRADVAETLTAGQALAATQAAIWEYGTDGKEKVNTNNLVKGEFTYNQKTGEAGVNWNPDEKDKKNIETLRELLVYLAENSGGIDVKEQISEDDIKGATIVLEKKTGTTETVAATGTTHDVYEAELSFTLAVSTSAINGDLIVQVTDATGKNVATRRLAGDDTYTGYGKIYPDHNGTYTITDVKLAEGVMITLNLSGTQQLADGVYIYQSKNYQDFIGLSTLENEVNLSVDMIFEVEAPDVEIQKEGSDSTRTKNDTYTESRTGSRTDTREDYTTETDISTEENGESVRKVYADVTITEVTRETQTTRKEWNSSWVKKHNINDNDDNDNGGGNDPGSNGPDGGNDPGPGGPGGGNDDHVADDAIILGEEVPLANMAGLPKTGDPTGGWALLSVLSGIGLAIMSLTGKKRKEEE